MTATGTVVVAGGGATGSSVAAHLLADPAFRGRVVVVEKDPTYRLAASALSAASIRQQYSQALNVRMSLHGLSVLRALDRDRAGLVGLQEHGYLYLAGDEAGAETLGRNHVVQSEAGADIALLGQAGLAERFGWLRTDDLALGAWGRSGEGWFDGWSLLQAFRQDARTAGAIFLADEVVGVETSSGRVVAARLKGAGRLPCDTLVNAAGSGGPALAASAGIEIPVVAKRRSVFSFTCRAALPGFPLLIDTSGVWCRPEGRPVDGVQSFISGWSPLAESDPDWRDDDPGSQAVDWPLFDEIVWPALAGRVPAFEAIRPGRAWAGPYDMNLVDHNAILGPAPELADFHLCNGFSGHGLQHAAAVGRGLAELIVHGRYLSLDLSPLGFGRLAAGRPFLERNVI